MVNTHTHTHAHTQTHTHTQQQHILIVPFVCIFQVERNLRDIKRGNISKYPQTIVKTSAGIYDVTRPTYPPILQCLQHMKWKCSSNERYRLNVIGFTNNITVRGSHMISSNVTYPALRIESQLSGSLIAKRHTPQVNIGDNIMTEIIKILRQLERCAMISKVTPKSSFFQVNVNIICRIHSLL